MKYIALILLVTLLSSCSGKVSDGKSNSLQPSKGSEILSENYINTYSIRENDLNPLRISSESGRLILSLVFRPLVIVGQNFDYSYSLAETISISNDCKKITVMLKKDVKWDDGTSFTSSDIDYTIEKIKEYGDESPYFEVLDNVTDCYKDGTFGYVFELENPDSGFPCLLNFPIVKNDSLDDGVLLKGTGDYSITDYKAFSSFVLSSKSATNEKTVNKIKVSLLPDKQSAYSSYKLGKIDLMKLSVEDSASFSIDDSKTFIESNTNKYTFLAVNHKNTLLGDAALRRIIAEMLSNQSIITDLLPGFAVHTDSFVNPFAYFATKNENTASDIKKSLDSIGFIADHSVVRAKEIDGVKRQLSFDLLVNSDNPTKIIAAEYISNLLGTFGVETTLKKVPYDLYIEALVSGVFDFALCETNISLNNNYSFLMKTDGSANFGGYSSEQADALLDAIPSSADKKVKVDLYRQLQSLFYNDMPHIPLWFLTSKTIYNNKLIEKPALGGIFDEFSTSTSWKLK